MNRRGFLINTLVGLSSSQLAAAREADSAVRRDPFTLGVASGDITANSAVLWTRLAPEPLADDGGMPPADVSVVWELAEDSQMSKIVTHGESIAPLALGHSVHVDIDGLEPGKEYWYRFKVSKHQSRIGRTKTLPAVGTDLDSMRFATASCQNFTHGYFSAYQQMVDDRPDFVIHLGDYIYDVSFGETFRRHEAEQIPVSLQEYRRRHALYKTDEHLQLAHAELPFFTTIDNHDAIEDANTSQFAQRAAAYQAWYEYMPVRGYPSIGANRFDLHRRIQLGDLAQICLLDARQFRDNRTVCENNDYPNYGFGNYRERCEAVFVEDRSLLGQDQQQWLQQTLKDNQATWNVLASPGPFLPFSYRHDGKDLRYIGSWDVFPAERQRIAETLSKAETGHPIILSGDVHSCWAFDGAKAAAPNESLPFVEFVTSSISANWPSPLSQPVLDNLQRNPQVAFYDGEKRGYMLHDVSKKEWCATARAISSTRVEDPVVSDLARFVVDAGREGLRLAE